MESSPRVALATEGRPAARKIAANIADMHLVFISCVTRLKNRFYEAQRLRKHTLILAPVKFFPGTIKQYIRNSPESQEKMGFWESLEGGYFRFCLRILSRAGAASDRRSTDAGSGVGTGSWTR